MPHIIYYPRINRAQLHAYESYTNRTHTEFLANDHNSQIFIMITHVMMQ